MARPPIVGVPALTLWVAGPSSRIGWPIWWRASQRINAGVPRNASHSATPPDSINESTALPLVRGCRPPLDPSGDQRQGLGPVVEGERFPADLLGGLVTL